MEEYCLDNRTTKTYSNDRKLIYEIIKHPYWLNRDDIQRQIIEIFIKIHLNIYSLYFN